MRAVTDRSCAPHSAFLITLSRRTRRLTTGVVLTLGALVTLAFSRPPAGDRPPLAVRRSGVEGKHAAPRNSALRDSALTYSISVAGAYYGTSAVGRAAAAVFMITNTSASGTISGIGFSYTCDGTVISCTSDGSGGATSLASGGVMSVAVYYTGATTGTGWIQLNGWGTDPDEDGVSANSGHISISVVPDTVASMTLSPGWQIITAAQTTTLTASVFNELGQVMSSPSVSWSTSASGVATVSSGVVTGVAAGSATITATSGSASATASIVVGDSAGTSSTPMQLILHGLNPGQTIDRGSCLTMAAGPGASISCGNLEIVHPMDMPTTTMNKERAPALLYNSGLAQPQALIASNIIVRSGVHPSSLVYTLEIPGKSNITKTVSWSGGMDDGNARRVVIPVNATSEGLTTGAYAYTLQVVADSSSVPIYEVVAHDTLVVVTRTLADWASGWWVEGLEMLSDNTPSSSLKLWVGGDGSTRLFTQQSSTIWTVASTVDRPDTLEKVTTGGVITWRRHLRNGAYVEFDNAGQHVNTVNTQGHVTRFVYSDSTGMTPDSIVLPVPSGSSRVLAYRTYAGYIYGPGSRTIYGGGLAYPWSCCEEDGYTWYIDYSRPEQLTITGPDTNSMIYEVDGLGRVTTRMEPSGSATAFTYDSAGLVSGYTLISSDTTGYTWPDSLPATVCEAQSGDLSTCQSAPFLASAASTFLIGPRYYDPYSPAGDTTRYWLNGFGAPIAIRDALGDSTAIAYGDARFPLLATSLRKPSGYTQTTAYTARGLTDSSVAVNPLGTSVNAVTHYTWHAKYDRPTQITAPTGDVQTFSYDSTTGNTLTTGDGRGALSQTAYTYDGVNRLSTVQPPGNSSGQTQQFSYDTALGNLLTTTTPIGFVATYTDDSVGRVARSVTPIDSAQSLSLKTHYTYDARSRVTLQVDSAPATSYSLATVSGSSVAQVLHLATTYNIDGLVTNVASTDPAHSSSEQTSSYSYDTFDRLISDPAHSYALDRAGNQIKVDYDSLTYDALDRVVSRYTLGFYPYKYAYDGCNPLLDDCNFTTQFPFNTSVYAPTSTATFSYDADGHMLTANNYDSHVSRTYYPNGLVQTDTQRIRKYGSADYTAHIYGLHYDYDLGGRRTDMQMPTNLGHGCTPGSSSGCKQTYTYDPDMGALTDVTSIFGNIYSMTYDSAGRRSTSTGPGGAVVHWTYDPDGRLIQRLEQRGTGTVVTVHSDTTRMDARGKAIDVGTGGLSDVQNTFQAAYGGLGHLIGSEYVRVSPSVTTTDQWTTDALGNQITFNHDAGLADAYSGNDTIASGRLGSMVQASASTSVPFVATYLGTEGEAIPGLPGGAVKSVRLWYWDGSEWYMDEADGTGYDTEEWDGYDRKMHFFERAGLDTAGQTRFVWEEYRYDALGRRILKRSEADSICSGEYCLSSITRFVYDGDQIVYEIRVPGGMSASTAQLEADTATGPFYGVVGYVHGLAIDAPLALDRNGLVIIPHMNFRGLYDAGSDTTGADCCATVDWVGQERTPFLDLPPKTVNGWAGSLIQQQQDESGLMYRRNRYYDPNTGQFTQPDPIGFAGGNNLYGYANGDPINFADPFGLWGVPGWVTRGAGCALSFGKAGYLALALATNNPSPNSVGPTDFSAAAGCLEGLGDAAGEFAGMMKRRAALMAEDMTWEEWLALLGESLKG